MELNLTSNSGSTNIKPLDFTIRRSVPESNSTTAKCVGCNSTEHHKCELSAMYLRMQQAREYYELLPDRSKKYRMSMRKKVRDDFFKQKKVIMNKRRRKQADRKKAAKEEKIKTNKNMKDDLVEENKQLEKLVDTLKDELSLKPNVTSRFSPHQKQILMNAYEEYGPRPSNGQYHKLAKSTNLTKDQLYSYFSHQRKKTRKVNKTHGNAPPPSFKYTQLPTFDQKVNDWTCTYRNKLDEYTPLLSPSNESIQLPTSDYNFNDRRCTKEDLCRQINTAGTEKPSKAVIMNENLIRTFYEDDMRSHFSNDNEALAHLNAEPDSISESIRAVNDDYVISDISDYEKDSDHSESDNVSEQTVHEVDLYADLNSEDENLASTIRKINMNDYQTSFDDTPRYEQDNDIHSGEAEADECQHSCTSNSDSHSDEEIETCSNDAEEYNTCTESQDEENYENEMIRKAEFHNNDDIHYDDTESNQNDEPDHEDSTGSSEDNNSVHQQMEFEDQFYKYWDDQFTCCEGCDNTEHIFEFLWNEKYHLEADIAKMKETTDQCPERVDHFRQLNADFKNSMQDFITSHCESLEEINTRSTDSEENQNGSSSQDDEDFDTYMDFDEQCYWDEKFTCCDDCIHSETIRTYLWDRKFELEARIAKLIEGTENSPERFDKIRQLNSKFEEQRKICIAKLCLSIEANVVAYRLYNKDPPNVQRI